MYVCVSVCVRVFTGWLEIVMGFYTAEQRRVHMQVFNVCLN